MEELTKWDYRFMDVANLVAGWSSCLRRSVGCVIVKDKRIMTTGYNGAPSGIKSCVERNECLRDTKNITSGTNLESCYAVHAEENAILQAAKLGIDLNGAYLYCTHQPCNSCAKSIINAGIKRVYFKNPYPDTFGLLLLKSAKIEVIRI